MGSVRLLVPYGSYEERMAAEELRKALSSVGDVMFDPPAAVGATEGSMEIYGADVDQLFESIRRSLERINVPPGTSAFIVSEGEPRKVELR